MTNEQIKKLLEKALHRSEKEGTALGTHDVVKLVVQIELIISMLVESSKPIIRELEYPYGNYPYDNS